MKNRLLVTSAIAGLAFFAATPAFAACDDNAPVNGTTVTCTVAGGADANGVQGGADNVTLNVQNNAVITTANLTFNLGANANVTLGAGSSLSTNNADGAALGTGSTLTMNTGASLTSTVNRGLNVNGAAAIIIGTGASINGTGAGGIVYLGGGGDVVDITLDGTVTNGINFGNSDARLELHSNYAVTGTVTANGASDEFVLGGAANGTFDTTSIGAGYNGFETFIKEDASAWTLSGAVARDWAITGGTLEGTTANLGNVDNDGTLRFTSGGTYAGDITGTGAFVKDGGATLILTGTNDFTGATTVQNSTTMQIQDAAALSATSGITVNQSTFQFGSAFTYDRNFTIGALDATFDTQAFNNTLSGDIGGAGTLIKDGGGVLTLTGTNTYADGINILQGRLIGDTDSLVGNVTNGGTLQFNQATDDTFSGDIVGTGAFEKLGAGNLTLSGTNTYQGGTDLQAGTLTGTTASLQGDILNNAAIVFDQAGNGTYGGTLSGTGSFTKEGAGTVTLSGANTYGGVNNLNAGTVRISANNNLGSAIGGNHVDFNGGTLQFDASFAFARGVLLTGAGTVNTNGNNVDISGDMDGIGTLTKTGAGTLTLSSVNSNSGVVAVNGGTLSVGASNNLGDASATNDLGLDGGTLLYTASFNQARDIALGAGDGTINTNGFNTTLSGIISGAAGSDFTKSGTGTLTMNGVNTYAGATFVNAGTLVVNGSNASSATTIGASGTLKGTGTVGTLVANGTLAPGNSIGTLNVNGPLTFNNGSHYAVEYTLTPNDSDKIIATGAVTINAGAILDLTGANGNYAASTDYTILQGASVTGTFDTVNNNRVFLDAAQNIVGGNSLVLTLTRNNTSFAEILAPEETDFGTALDELANDLTTAFTGLTAEQAQAAAATLSNEQQGAIITFAGGANTGALNSIANRMGKSFGANLEQLSNKDDDGTYVAALLEPAAGGALDHEVNVWFQAIGATGKSDSNMSDPSNKRHSYGALAGVDRAFDDKGYYGIFAGYEEGEVETPSQGASSDVSNYHAGAYASRPVAEGLLFNTGAAFTWHDIDTVRYVSFPGFTAAPESDTTGYSASAFAEISKPMRAQHFAWSPFARFTIAHTDINGYAETNGGLANLVVEDSAVTNPILMLGSRFAKKLAWSDNTIDLSASLGWQHVFGTIEPGADMRFSTGTTLFESNGAPRARSALVVGFGADAQLSSAVSAFAGYNGTLAVDSRDHSFEAGLKIKF